MDQIHDIIMRLIMDGAHLIIFLIPKLVIYTFITVVIMIMLVLSASKGGGRIRAK